MVRALFLGLLILCSVNSFASTLETSVDREQVGEGETLILTVRYDSNVLSGNPDFSPLEQQFNVLNQQRKNSFQFINGNSESWTIWTVMLSPKRLGNLIIPSLNFNGAQSKPIQIQVKKVSSNIKDTLKDVFFDTQTDVKTSYVQAQIVYSEKLYFAVGLDNSQLSDVAVDEAIVEPLGDTKQYRTQLNGKTYDVYERQFLIFPQTSGDMIIPGPIYNGEVSNGRYRPGRPIRISHPPTKLQILPQPASYPASTWLPAKALSVSHKWLGNPNQVKVGEPITLELAISATGLSSAQLPPVELQEKPGLKYYPEPAINEDQISSQGNISTRKQSIAIVPTKAGTYQLPEIRIPWWNTQLGRLETAVLPAQTLNAIAPVGSKSIPQVSEPVKQTEDTMALTVPLSSEQTKEQTSNPIWIWASLIFALLWLATLVLWYFSKKTSQTAQANLPANEPEKGHTLADVKKACRASQPQQARIAILNYASHLFAKPIASLYELSNMVEDPSLQLALKELDQMLYGEVHDLSNWQGEYVWQLMKTIKQPVSTLKSPINDLYPIQERAHG